MPSPGILTELRWFGNDRKLNDRLRRVLDGWLGTRYGEGQRAKRIQVDCVQFVAGVLDELFAVKTPTFVPRLRADIALHSPERAYPTIKAFREAHYGMDEVEDGTVQPGDIIVTRAEHQEDAKERDAHVMIAGAERWTAYHAIPRVGVVKTTIACTRGILRVYRPRRKDLWASQSSS
jgi:hypothetical protein